MVAGWGGALQGWHKTYCCGHNTIQCHPKTHCDTVPTGVSPQQWHSASQGRRGGNVKPLTATESCGHSGLGVVNGGGWFVSPVAGGVDSLASG